MTAQKFLHALQVSLAFRLQCIASLSILRVSKIKVETILRSTGKQHHLRALESVSLIQSIQSFNPWQPTRSLKSEPTNMKSSLTIFVCFVVVTPLCVVIGWNFWKRLFLQADLDRYEEWLNRQEACEGPVEPATPSAPAPPPAPEPAATSATQPAPAPTSTAAA